jgi:hypothetical protein
LPDIQSDLEPAAASQTHQAQSHVSTSRALDVASVDLSSDYKKVKNLVEQALENTQIKSVPSFNPLSSLPVRGSSEWPKSGLLPAGDGGGKEEIEEDTRDMVSADDFNDTQPRRSCRKGKIIASQREKSTSTMVKDKTTKTIQKKKSVPLITEKHLQANRELLIGQKIKRFFPGHGGAIGTVKKYSSSNDSYYLTYSDGHHEWIPFLDILGLLPKS